MRGARRADRIRRRARLAPGHDGAPRIAMLDGRRRDVAWPALIVARARTTCRRRCRARRSAPTSDGSGPDQRLRGRGARGRRSRRLLEQPPAGRGSADRRARHRTRQRARPSRPRGVARGGLRAGRRPRPLGAHDRPAWTPRSTPRVHRRGEIVALADRPDLEDRRTSSGAGAMRRSVRIRFDSDDMPAFRRRARARGRRAVPAVCSWRVDGDQRCRAVGAARPSTSDRPRSSATG